MYKTYFHLRTRPFAAVPCVEHYFPAAAAEAARTTLQRTLERAEGIGLLTGGPGSGKTLLCQKLAQGLRAMFPAVLLAGGRLTTRHALLQAVLHDLGQPYRGLDEGELRLALADFLATAKSCANGILLVVDDAQTAPRRVLDELGTLANLVRDDQPAVRLLLAGNRLLEEHLTNPRLESLNQRVVARCYLQPLNRAETQEYLHGRIAAAGAQAARLFPVEACQAVYQVTEGVPRLVNQLGERVLVAVSAAGRRQVSRGDVEAAWADLQQLPAPSGGEPAAQGSVIEFGRLDDEPAEDRAQQEPETPAIVAPLDFDDHGTDDDDSVQLPLSEPVEHVRRLLADVAVEFGDVAAEFGDDLPLGPATVAAPLDRDRTLAELFEEEEVVVDRRCRKSEEPAPAPLAEQQPGPIPVAVPKPTPRPANVPSPGLEESETRTVPMHRGKIVENIEPDDQDMVIIEHGYEDPPPWQTRKVVPVPRHEYSRLFAKLRYK
jgi:type II secretory pathway predicted ATPase ExeA